VYGTAVRADQRRDPLLDRRPVTVADTIEMTEWADRRYAAGAGSAGRVGVFSPDGRQFVVLLKKGNLATNTSEFSVVLFDAKNPAEVRPQVLITMTSSSNREGIKNVKWLGDNETIVFLGENSGEIPQVYSLAVKSRKLTKLTSHPTPIVSYDISWSGDQIIFEAHPPSVKKIDTPEVRRNGLIITGGYPDNILTEDCAIERPDQSEQLYVQGPDGVVSHIETDDFLSDWEPLSMAPNGHFGLVSVYRKEIPQEWAQYEDEILRPYFREKRKIGEYSNVAQYMLLDTQRKILQPFVDAPLSSGATGFAWVESGQSLVISGTYLPLDVRDPEVRSERTRRPFVVEVMLPKRRYFPITSRSLAIREWRSSSAILVLEEPGHVAVHPVGYQKRGSAWHEISQVDSSLTSPSPEVVLEEDLNTPPRLYFADSDGKQKVLLLDLNPQFRGLALGRVSEFHWRARDGHDMTGGLYLPPDFSPGKRYPLVIQTHGFDKDRFWIDGPFSSAFAAQPLASRGIAVLQVGQPVESGPHRTASNTTEEGPREMAAYEGAIDELDRQGLIDPSRVGLIGFSRTAYRVAYTLTHSKYHFAAATLADGFEGGYVNYVLFQAVDSVWVNGGLPSGESLQSWLKRSPGFNLDKVMAPVRIEEYAYGSVLGGWEWFSGLSFRDKPVELIWIPFGTHLLVKPWERLVSQQGNVDWFDYWLNRRSDPDPAKRQQYQRWDRMRTQLPGVKRDSASSSNQR